MTRVDEVLERTRGEGRAALIGYLPVGFPTVDESIEAMTEMVDAGVDIVEVGVPYSDPLMDGPTIQEAATRALAAGVHVKDAFSAVRAVTDAGAAAVVMTYWNPVLRHGVDRFAADLAQAGGSGLITPDLVPDEADEWLEASETHDLDRIFLVAPSSTMERLILTADHSSGFIYAASLMGVTGTRASLDAHAKVLADRTRKVTELPVCVGLGVSTPAQAHEVAQFADGVIVGSALVRCLLERTDRADGISRLRDAARALREGVVR